jgi:60 kDa SS-A/Ro ribonucleoprotein
LRLIWALEKAKQTESTKEIIGLIRDYGLTREMIPTQFLNDVGVWDALLNKMPMTAMIRSLGKMTSVGLLKPMSDAVTEVIVRLHDETRLKKARVHPLSVLVALKIYQQGHGMRGKLSWSPLAEVIDSLDDAFYLSFSNVEPMNKRTMLALDVSGSMTWNNISGMPITPREASAAMAMVTARVEPMYVITAFSRGLTQVSLSPRQRLDDIVKTVSSLHAGGTDCALPMMAATRNNLNIDTFIVYTDNETWAGRMHPYQALQEYRQKTGIPAKLAVVGMVSNKFSIANPDDAGMLDVIGFDTTTPNIITGFARE